MSDKEKNQLVAEFEILARLKHRNIVEYFHRDHIKKEQSIHLYMEYCGSGDLSTIIKRCKAERTMVPEHYVWSIFAQVLQALYRCHNGINPPEVGDVFSPEKPMMPQPTGDIVRILHRDLKPDNSRYPLVGRDTVHRLTFMASFSRPGSCREARRLWSFEDVGA